MKDFLIEILDYNESILKTEVLKNTTKDKAIETAVELCQKVNYSYCFNIEEVQNDYKHLIIF